MVYNKKNDILPVAAEANENYAGLLNIYLENNPKVGYLTFQITESSAVKGLSPIPNAKVTVSKAIGDSYYFSKILTTTIDGKTDPLGLPTVSSELSKVPGRGRPYATYNATVEAQNYMTKSILDIPIFEGITAIQSVTLEPILDKSTIPPAEI